MIQCDDCNRIFYSEYGDVCEGICGVFVRSECGGIEGGVCGDELDHLVMCVIGGVFVCVSEGGYMEHGWKRGGGERKGIDLYEYEP